MTLLAGVSDPGHAPYRGPVSRVLGDRWAPEITAATRRAMRRSPLKDGVATLAAPQFASALMQRDTLLLALAAHALGLRGYDYLFTAAAVMRGHWSHSATSARAHMFEVS